MRFDFLWIHCVFSERSATYNLTIFRLTIFICWCGLCLIVEVRRFGWIHSFKRHLICLLPPIEESSRKKSWRERKLTQHKNTSSSKQWFSHCWKNIPLPLCLFSLNIGGEPLNSDYSLYLLVPFHSTHTHSYIHEWARARVHPQNKIHLEHDLNKNEHTKYLQNRYKSVTYVQWL